MFTNKSFFGHLKFMKPSALLLLFFLISNIVLKAQINERLDVKDMSPVFTKDLINTNVSVASKSSESIYDAPGVVSVITNTEIQLFGANNLLEVLERVASIYHIGTYFAPNNVLTVRGDLATPYNNHVLILINGRPTRENLFGGIDYPIYLSMPLQAIERIEVIRGPGSVLYGTNAYSGVVNLITKEVVEDETQVGFEYGSFETFAFNALSTKIKDKLKVNTSVRYFGQKGWEHKAIGEDGNPLDYTAGQNNIGGMLNLSYDKLNVNTFITYSSQANTGVLPSQTAGGAFFAYRNRSINTLRGFFDIGYQFKLTEKLKVSTNATYNGMNTRFSNPSGDFVGKTQDLLLEATGFYNANKSLNIIFGTTGYLQGGLAEIGDDVGRGVKAYNKFWYNAYSQIDYRLPFKDKFKMKIIAGGQYNKPSDVDANFVPRLGLITDINESFGFKLLYGQAFRAAFEAENNLQDLPILTGNPRLIPEKVTTFDAQLFLGKDKYQLILTYFNSLQRDLIIQAALPSGIISYENANNLRLEGLELEFKASIAQNFFFNGSMTLQKNELTETASKEKTKNYTLVPEAMAKFGLFYALQSKALSIGIFNTYFGDAGKITVADNVKNPDAKAFHYLTAKVNADLTKLFKSRIVEELRSNKIILSFYATNLLNQKIYYPEFVRRNTNALPGRSGIALYASLHLQF